MPPLVVTTDISDLSRPSGSTRTPAVAEAWFAAPGGRGLRGVGLVEVVEAVTAEDVPGALERVECAVASGLHACGYLAYEAAPAFDPALKVHSAGAAPVLTFALFESMQDESLDDPPGELVRHPDWRAALDESRYRSTLSRIREYIAAGDTYQINFTFPLTAAAPDDPAAWFRRLYAAQPTANAACLRFGTRHLLSLSPELFFELDGTRLATRPMKGTRPRGLWPAADAEMAEALRSSAKDRAENLMIVDLLRNDMGRVCRTGTVRAEGLFEVERYATLWQMTSSLSGETDASVSEILAALFPSGSITGAPKVRAMEIIRELEDGPRGVYCGAIGYWRPGRRARFNVAIRTIDCDVASGRAEYGIGSGVTWDSDPGGEYSECLLKAQAVSETLPPFQLLESLRWENGFTLFERHLRRMRESADYFGIPFSEKNARETLERALPAQIDAPLKVRLLLDADGAFSATAEPLSESLPVHVAWALRPINSRDLFLYHKTTHRAVYADALAGLDDVDDALLWNERGEATEATTSNIVIERNGERLTPPIESGLLAGTLRSELLESGKVRACTLTRHDVETADRVWLVNSVRGWREAFFADGSRTA